MAVTTDGSRFVFRGNAMPFGGRITDIGGTAVSKLIDGPACERSYGCRWQEPGVHGRIFVRRHLQVGCDQCRMHRRYTAGWSRGNESDVCYEYVFRKERSDTIRSRSVEDLDAF